LVHTVEPHRPTKDVDLLGLGSDDSDDVAQVFRDVCTVSVIPDGLAFDSGSVRAAVIRENARYGGVRIGLTAALELARIRLQVDVGFGDVVTPATESITFPVLLGEPAPRLQGYPLATVVAEKLEALIQIGLATSRMKDLYDLWHILRTFDLPGDVVRKAIRNTFTRRGTPLEAPPTALTKAFWADASKQAQWSAFLRRNDLHAPDLETVVRDVAVRLAPMLPT
jgi:hypothetical protein